MKQTQVHFLWREPEICRRFRTGVCLHGHTMHSKESLTFIPRYGSMVPVLGWELKRLARNYERKSGRLPDYSRGHWTPPLAAPEAYRLEGRVIEEMGLTALVSLTDHDNIDAGLHLRQFEETSTAPVSVEWTVPVEEIYFHLGVHNIPAAEAGVLMAQMAEATRHPNGGQYREILAAIHRHPDTLVVLNHPMWDQSGVGPNRHRAVLREFLAASGNWFHALELNGLRPWDENRETMDWARAGGYPVVSGGDRHGCEPSAVVNLTRAATFSGFAAEVRDGRSVVGFQNHYREPHGFRVLKAISDIMAYYPENGSRSLWSDRIFCQLYTGEVVSVSQLWKGNRPGVVRIFEHAVRLSQRRVARSLLRGCFRNGIDLDREILAYGNPPGLDDERASYANIL